MKNIIYLTLILFTSLTYSQNFEGQVTYKTTMENLFPEMMTDSVFQEKVLKPAFGEQGFILQNYFYKGNRFMSETSTGLENGFELYSPEKKKVYAWKENSSQAIVKKTNVHPEMDAFVEFVETKETDTILNVLCKKVLLKSKMGTAELWYNSEYLKINPKDYSEFKLDHKNLIFEKYGCLPFRIKAMTFNIEVIEFKTMKVSDEKFKLPEFESEIEQ
ncbi:hypothetical protein [Lacinutrix undariae]